MGATEFQYPKLTHRRQIRLLDVFIPDGSTDLHGIYEVASLDWLPGEYKAISYHWDRSLPDQRIWLGANRYLTINGAAASALRWVTRSGANCLVWLDQLCINQRDLQEKSAQIRLMTDIFASAEQVIAWLGEASADSDSALGFVTKLHKLALNLSRTEAGKARETLLEQSPHELRGALVDLMERPWFTRIWMVQEAILARECHFVCGTASIPWAHLEGTFLAIRQYGMLNLFIKRGSRGSRRTLAMSTGILFYTMISVKAQRDRGQPLSMVAVMMLCRVFQATDPRDKIFALLGVVPNAQEAVPDPDYLTTTEEIYSQTHAFLMRRDEGFLSLHCAGIGQTRNCPTLPSWVPDWSAWRPISAALMVDLAAAVGYRAAGGTDAIIVTLSSHLLSLEGRMIDFVDQIQPPDPLAELVEFPEAASALKVLAWYEAAAKLILQLQPYPTLEHWNEVLWRTLKET